MRTTTSALNERISDGRVRRGEHAQAARMLRQHDVEQLAVETLRLVLDFGDVEARLEVEIFGAGALLEIEVDDAGRRPARHRMVQLECRLQGQRRAADAAGGRHEGVDLRFRVFLAARPLQHADAGAHQVGGGDRLDQEVGDLKLHQDAHGGSVEFLRHDEDRRPALEPARDALQRLDLFELRRIHVDDDGVAVGFLDFAAQFDDALFDRRRAGSGRTTRTPPWCPARTSCRSRRGRSAWSCWKWWPCSLPA